MYKEKYVTCISHVPSKVNVHKREAYVSKKIEKDKGHNTTPVLDVKTLASQSTSREMIIIGRATSDARVKIGEEWGDITGRSDQRGRNGSWSMCDGRRCIGDGNDYRNVVMGCLRETNHRDGLTGSSSGRRRDQMSRDWW